MATNKKFTELGLAVPAPTDIFPFISNPSSTKVPKRGLISSITAALAALVEYTANKNAASGYQGLESSRGIKTALDRAGDGFPRAGVIQRRFSTFGGGTPTLGDGGEFLIQLQNSNGDLGNIGGFIARLLDVVPGTMKGRVEIAVKGPGTFDTTFDETKVIVDWNGYVGIGSDFGDITRVPEEQVHIRETSPNLLLEDKGTAGANFKVRSQSQQFNVGMGADKALHLFDLTHAKERFILDSLGNATVNYEATITSVGNQIGVTGACSLLRCNNATDLTIQGIAAGLPGQVLTIQSVGAGNVFLAHQNTSETTAANRLINHVTVGNTPLAAGKGSATYKYDGTTGRWRLLQHEQGDWISAAFSGGDYTGGGSMTVTVDAGDVDRNTYYVRGKMYFWGIQLTNFTTGGTPNSDVKIALPGGYTLNDDTQTTIVVFPNGGTFETGRCFPNTSSPMNFTFNRAALANWANGTNNNSLSGSIFFPIA